MYSTCKNFSNQVIESWFRPRFTLQCHIVLQNRRAYGSQVNNLQEPLAHESSSIVSVESSNDLSSETAIHSSTFAPSPIVLTDYQRQKLSPKEIPYFETIIKLFDKNKSTLISKKDLLFIHGLVGHQQLKDTVKMIQKAKRLVLKREITFQQREYIHNAVTSLYQETRHSRDSVNLVALSGRLERILSISRRQIYEVAYNHAQSLERVPILHKHKEQIRSFLADKELNLKHVSRYCDQLSNVIDLSRNQLYELIKEEIKKSRTQEVTNEVIQEIQNALHDACQGETNSQLCDCLETKLSLPRNQIIKLLQSETLKMKRQLVTSTHKKIIRENVVQNILPNALCDTIEDLFQKMEKPLPRKLIYELIIRQRNILLRNQLSASHQSKIKEYISRDENTTKSLPEMCDDLQKVLDVPRPAIYKEVVRYLQKNERLTISHQERSIARKLVKKVMAKSKDLNISEICDELQNQVQLSRRTIYEIVVHEIDKLQSKNVNFLQQRKQIRAYLQANSMYYESIPKICNALESMNLDLSRKQIYRIIREEVVKLQRGQLTSNQIQEIRKLATCNTYMPITTRYFNIANEFGISVTTVRDVLGKHELKELRQQVTQEQRELVKQFISENAEYLNNIPLLCDLIQEKELFPSSLPRSIQKEIVYQAIEKYNRLKKRKLREVVHDN